MLLVILSFKRLCDMSRFFNIPRFRVIFECIRNYPKVRKCRNEAIRVKELGYYDGQLGLVNDIIKNPEKHFKEFSEYGDIDLYIDYVIYSNQSAS